MRVNLIGETFRDLRSIAAGVLRRCIERFDAELAGSVPRDWSVHERAVRTLVGEIAFVRTVFRDEFGRRRVFADELLGIPPRDGLWTCYTFLDSQMRDIGR